MNTLLVKSLALLIVVVGPARCARDSNNGCLLLHRAG